MRTTGNHQSVGDCPALDVLRAYASGRLPSDTVEAVAAHVATCVMCSESLGSVAPEDDPLNAALRACVAAGPALGADPVEVQALAGAGARHPTLTDNRAAAVTEAPGPVPGSPPPKRDARAPLAAIHDYLLVELIDRGGMGAVYRAVHTRLDQVVALKTLRHDVCATPEARERFLTEGKAAARLDHPNIVRVLDSGEFDGEPYLVMEYVSGGSLSGKLAQRPLPPAGAAALVERLARAMQYAHERGVYHRDLKPSNVLLGPDGTPKVGDFGLARLLDQDARITQSLAVMGTPAYMPPEQADGGAKQVGPAADVYGLGAILYEALTGRPPFEGTKDQVLCKVREVDPCPPSRLWPEVPSGLEAICLKCLEKRPGARYASAGKLAEDLARWQEGKTPTAKPCNWLRRRLRAGRRYPVRTGLLAALALCAVAAFPVADRLDPDREIKRIERELAAGKTVELIGATGGPRWSRWAIQEDPNQAPWTAEKAFPIQSWGFGLLELVRDPQLDVYQVSAEIRHLESHGHGGVGVFVSHRSFQTGSSRTHQFVRLQFDDISDPIQPPRAAADFGAPKYDKSPVRVMANLLTPGGDEYRWDNRVADQFKRLCVPGGAQRTRWRRVLLTVTPTAVRAVWDDNKSAEILLSFSEIASRSNAVLQAVKPNDPAYPFASAIPAEFTPRGGVGMFVYRGSALFRAVTVGPPRK